MQRPVPLRPHYSIANRTAPLVRAAVASLLAHVEHSQMIEVAQRLWPSDRNTEIITKAASAPATTTGPGWGDVFVATVIPDFVLNLGPASAASEVLKRGALQLTYDGTGAFQIPKLLTVAAASTSFVKEADMIPARSFGLDSVTLSRAQTCDHFCFRPGNRPALHTRHRKNCRSGFDRICRCGSG